LQATAAGTRMCQGTFFVQIYAKNKSKNRENNRKNYFHFYMDLLEMKVL